MILDLSDEMKPNRKRMGRDRKGRIRMRRPDDVVGVCVHQTAVLFGARPSHLKRAKGDPAMAIAFRVAEDVPAHMVSLGRLGINVRGIPLLAYANHGGTPFNLRTLGLEIEGRFPGVVDRPETAPDEARGSFWGPYEKRTPWTPERQDCAEEGLQALVEAGREAGCPLRFWVAHRQSSATRRSDPGEEIWRALTPLAIHLGLEPQAFAAFGKGRPIPTEWGGFGPY